jgi:hypothetical protein
VTKKRQNVLSVTAFTQLRSSQTSASRTRDASSMVRQSKRLRQGERDLGLQVPKSIESTDIFGSQWLRDPNCVGSSIAVLGRDLDEDISRWSNWTASHSKTPASTSTSDVEVEQSTSYASPSECAEERCVRGDCRPLDQHGIEWTEIDRSSGRLADGSARTVHQPNTEPISVGLSAATYSQHEDENVQRQ